MGAGQPPRRVLTESADRKTSAHCPATSSFRRDIQGLRALAVVAVVLNHLIAWPSGGFVGVDVFFVISGFLITGLLLREFERTGRMSLRGFYARRGKRILPAAVLTLAVTVVMGFVVFAKQRAVSAAWDALSALTFVSNWRFANTGVDYFEQGGAVSPVRHFWSLSVEEQFYFVWPWLLVGAVATFCRTRRLSVTRVRLIAAVLVGLAVTLSFGLATVQVVESPTVAYFSSLTRAWELGVGALLAAAGQAAVGQHRVMRSVLAWIGLVGLIVSCFLITSETRWPGVWTLLPVLSTAAVLMSGIGAENRGLWLLSNPVSVYLGDVSYSLYLWHWPVIVFGRALLPGGGALASAGLALLSLAAAIAAFHAVEKPLWKSPLFVRAGRAPADWQHWRRIYLPQVRVGVAGLVVIGLGVGTAISRGQSGPPNLITVQNDAHVSGTALPMPSRAGAEVRRVALAVTDAIRARSWPVSLTPGIDEIGPQSRVAAWIRDGCLAAPGAADPFETARRCIYGDVNGKRRLVLVGDSQAISYLPAIQVALDGQGWAIHVLTMTQCPFAAAAVDIEGIAGASEQCTDFQHRALALTAELRADAVVAVQADSTLIHLRSGARGDDAAREVAPATSDALSTLADAAEHVYVLNQPPPTVPFGECFTATGQPGDCTREPDALHITMNALLAQSTSALDNPAITYIDTESLFCVAQQCPAVVDGIIVRADKNHLTEDYSRYIGPAIGELLEAGR